MLNPNTLKLYYFMSNDLYLKILNYRIKYSYLIYLYENTLEHNFIEKKINKSIIIPKIE